MNIAYPTQLINIDITNKNSLEYMKKYDKPEFKAIMPSQLLSSEILDWAKNGTLPDNAIYRFMESRVNNILLN